MANSITSKDLYKYWSAPDNSRLAKNQISIRLPIHVLAKLTALESLFPNKTRTQIIGDLLSTAIDDFEESLPSIKGDQVDRILDTKHSEPKEIDVYEDVGTKGRYYDLYTIHLKELEKQLGNEKYNKKIRSVFMEDDLTVMESETIGYVP